VEEDRGEVGYLKFFSRAKIGVSVAKGRMYVARRPKISAFGAQILPMMVLEVTIFRVGKY